MLDRLRNEPAILTAVVLGVFQAASSFFVDVGAGIDWQTALGKALGLFGLAGGAGTVIRQLVFGPKTVDMLLDADAVIAAAERGEH